MLDRERYRKREREKRDDLRRDWMLTWRRQLRHHSPASSLSFSAKLFSFSLFWFSRNDRKIYYQRLISKSWNQKISWKQKESDQFHPKPKQKLVSSFFYYSENGGYRSPEKESWQVRANIDFRVWSDSSVLISGKGNDDVFPLKCFF